MDDLVPAGICAVAFSVDGLLDMAWTARVGIAVDHLDDFDIVFLGPIAVDVEPDGFARIDAEQIGLTGNSHGAHFLAPFIAP